MKRSLVAASRVTALALASVLMLSACGSGGGEPSDTSSPGTDSPSSGETLIVYTNSNSDGRGEWLVAKAAEAGFTVEIVGAGGADLTNRVLAEKNNPVGDVVYGLNNMFFETLKAEDTIEAYTPSWADQVDQAAGDPVDGAFWPLVEQAIVMVYDTNTIDPATAPADITELWENETYHGRYEVNTALGQATPQLVLAGILTRYADDGGDLGIADEGWQQVQQYFAYGSPAVEGTDLYARITRGEVDFGILPSSGITARDTEYGTATGYIVPEVGVPYVTEQIAVIKGTGKQELAEQFIDWFGSAEVQGEFAAEFSAYPVNTEALAQALPEVVERMESLPRQEIDWAFTRENISQWVEKTELEYLP